MKISLLQPKIIRGNIEHNAPRQSKVWLAKARASDWSCPKGALTLVPFDGHPDRREGVLDIQACLGDEGCKVCLVVCPWTKAEDIR